jgi:hypothetical protein
MSTHGDEECAMRDVRCIVGLHKWKEFRVDGERFYRCVRCGEDRAEYVRPVPWQPGPL